MVMLILYRILLSRPQVHAGVSSPFSPTPGAKTPRSLVASDALPETGATHHSMRQITSSSPSAIIPFFFTPGANKSQFIVSFFAASSLTPRRAASARPPSSIRMLWFQLKAGLATGAIRFIQDLVVRTRQS